MFCKAAVWVLIGPSIYFLWPSCQIRLQCPVTFFQTCLSLASKDWNRENFLAGFKASRFSSFWCFVLYLLTFSSSSFMQFCIFPTDFKAPFVMSFVVFNFLCWVYICLRPLRSCLFHYALCSIFNVILRIRLQVHWSYFYNFLLVRNAVLFTKHFVGSALLFFSRLFNACILICSIILVSTFLLMPHTCNIFVLFKLKSVVPPNFTFEA